MSITRMSDLELRGKRVLIREDLNVPIDAGRITSTQRLDAALPTIKTARDAGANMVITTQLSPKSLYSRLVWVTFDTRGYVETPTYYGPDRRFKIEGFPDGQGRRKGDLPVEVAESDGSDLSQNEIDSLFAGARG